MNVSIIGPEKSGKTYLADKIARRLSLGRQIYFTGIKPTPFIKIDLLEFHKPRNSVCLMDDLNSYLESYDVRRKDLNLKEPVIMSKNFNRLNIFIMHGVDDSVKFFLRQSQFIYISKKMLDHSYKSSKLIKGIKPEVFGDRKYLFDRYKRY